MGKQAKCTKCKVRFVWKREIRLKKPPALCPLCGERLESTTHLLRFPVRKLEPRT